MTEYLQWRFLLLDVNLQSMSIQVHGTPGKNVLLVELEANVGLHFRGALWKSGVSSCYPGIFPVLSDYLPTLLHLIRLRS